MAYNARRNFLCALAVDGKAAHHLYHIDYTSHKSSYQLNLVKPVKFEPKRNQIIIFMIIISLFPYLLSRVDTQHGFRP